MKPKHQGGYVSAHAELCERTLVTLLRGLGPWKESIYLIGGLVPRYLIPSPVAEATPHAGTTDVDIVLDLNLLASVQAYRTLEQNLKGLGFVRGTNEEGQRQHHSWRKPIDAVVTIIVDLLCDTGSEQDRLPVTGRTGRHIMPASWPISHGAISMPATAGTQWPPSRRSSSTFPGRGHEQVSAANVRRVAQPGGGGRLR